MGNNKHGNMEKDFTPHEQALGLKEIGFDDPCLKFYATGKLVLGLDTENGDTNTKLNWYNPSYVSAPTFSQAFRFFREKGYQIWIPQNEEGYQFIIRWRFEHTGGMEALTKINSHEEAELECLKKLIELAKGK